MTTPTDKLAQATDPNRAMLRAIDVADGEVERAYGQAPQCEQPAAAPQPEAVQQVAWRMDLHEGTNAAPRWHYIEIGSPIPGKFTLQKVYVSPAAALAAQQAEQKPCLVSGACEHGNWCSETYCQKHCKFVKAERESLTDERVLQIVQTIDPAHEYLPRALLQLARAIERALAAQQSDTMAELLQQKFNEGRAYEHERLAAQQAEREGLTWQPIETAPKDGGMFLCWVSAVRYGETDDGQQYQQDASQVDFCWWRDGVDGNGYFDPACGQIADAQDVTHWMPLPPRPEIAHGIGKEGA